MCVFVCVCVCVCMNRMYICLYCTAKGMSSTLHVCISVCMDVCVGGGARAPVYRMHTGVVQGLGQSTYPACPPGVPGCRWTSCCSTPTILGPTVCPPTPRRFTSYHRHHTSPHTPHRPPPREGGGSYPVRVAGPAP